MSKKKNKKNQNDINNPQVDNPQVYNPQVAATPAPGGDEPVIAEDPQVIDSKMDEEGNVVFASDSYAVQDPKKKIIALIIGIAILVTILVVSIIAILQYKSYTRVFQDTDYPVAYREEKDRTLTMILRDDNTKKIKWNVEVADSDFVDVTLKGRDSGKKAKFIFSPKMAGVTKVTFAKSVDAAGTKIDLIKMDYVIYVSETVDGLKVSVVDEPNLEFGKEVIGSGTAYPIILNGDLSYFGDEESESGHLIFIKGKNDWNVEIESANVATDEFSTGDRVDIVLYYSEQGNESEDAADEDISKTDPEKATKLDADFEEEPAFDAGTSVETNTETDALEIESKAEIKFTSASLGITEVRLATFYKDGHIEFSKVEK